VSPCASSRALIRVRMALTLPHTLYSTDNISIVGARSFLTPICWEGGFWKRGLSSLRHSHSP
jgi:hypothetical protein